jgi:hypothetical protein
MKPFVSSDGLTALSAFTVVAEEWFATAMTIASGTGSDTCAKHAGIASMT